MGLYGSDGLHGGRWTVYPKDQWNPYRTNYTENHGTTRRRMDSISERSVESVQNKLHGKPRNNTEAGEQRFRDTP